ncbi:hypothetical protein P692DRAFT_20743026 [Suillus brevipes Sb2]|nr:hypothetical protein P692DRAFT_20743026 [Suillus brevipes Sb2]
MSQQGNAASTITIKVPLPDSSKSTSSQYNGASWVCSSPQEMQSCSMTLDEIDIQGSEELTQMFTRHSIDAVYASYAAAQHRVRQYTQLVKIYQLEADDWAVKIEKANHLMPDYKPVWGTSCLS